jgi:iron complex outermembrane receptor protein
MNTAFFLTKGKGYYEEYKVGEAYESYGLPNFVVNNDTSRTTDLIRQLWLDNDYYGQVLSVQYKNTNDQFTFGGGWNRYDGHHFGEIMWAQAGIPNRYRWYDLKAYKTDVNVYGKYQHKFSTSWEVYADLQYRRVLYNIGGFRKNPDLKVRNTFDFFNPKVGVTYSRNGYQAYLSYAQGNKEPNRDDFEAGVTQRPKAEKLHDFEAGFSQRGSQYDWSANLYYMLYKNQLVQTGKINDVGGYTRTNVDNSYRMGIELQGRIRFAQWFQAAANLTLSKNQIKNFTEYYDDYVHGGQVTIPHGNTDIAFSPSVIGGATLSFFPVRNLEISLPGKYVSRQYLDNTSDRKRSLTDYYVQDGRVLYSLRGLVAKEIVLIGQVNNVLNKKYNSNGYTYSYFGGSTVTENFYFPMAGTNFMMTVNIKF